MGEAEAYGPSAARSRDDPRRAGQVISVMADTPTMSGPVLMRRSRHATGRKLPKRRQRFKPMPSRTEEIPQEELQRRLTKQLDLINYYFDDATYLAKLESSAFKDIMIAQGVLIDKHLLLRAPPATGLQPQDRESLHDFLPKLLEEARRRGLQATLTQAKLTLPACGGPTGESVGEAPPPSVPTPGPTVGQITGGPAAELTESGGILCGN